MTFVTFALGAVAGFSVGAIFGVLIMLRAYRIAQYPAGKPGGIVYRRSWR